MAASKADSPAAQHMTTARRLLLRDGMQATVPHEFSPSCGDMLHWAYPNRARNSCFSTFPVALRGSESTISNCSGIFWGMMPDSRK